MKIAIAILAVLLIVGWLGFQVRPPAFAPFPQESVAGAAATPVPTNLPAPVASFYATAYGDTVSAVDSVVITGRGKIRPFACGCPHASASRMMLARDTGTTSRRRGLGCPS